MLSKSLSTSRARLGAITRLTCAACLCLLAFSSTGYAQNFPDCSSASADSDGDGWGWENNQTCVVTSGAAANSTAAPAASGSINGFPVCQSAATDHDNDGYGYENGRSCVVQRAINSQSNQRSATGSASGASDLPVCASTASDPDGDGYGWENNESCVVNGSSSSQTQTNNQSQANGSQANANIPETRAAKTSGFTIDDVTDVVLVTGQSNVLASNTGYDANLDRPNQQVFAYTTNGWEVADLYQFWDRFQHPGNHAGVTAGRTPSNSFAFHFGKSLVQRDVTRVVAFIVVPGPGKGISNWDRGTRQYVRIQDKVSRALADIPHKYSIDAVLWHQGENDWLYEGTADANPTGFTSENSYEYRNYYQIKLNALINNLRSEPWGTSQTAFICGETRRAEGVNRRLNELNHDNDPYTACVRGTDLPQRADDPYGSHFSAAGLRTLGKRYADTYFELSSR